MTIRRTLGALLVGLVLVAAVPSVSEAAHRHSRGCGHHVGKAYYDYSYDRDRYYDDVDYDAPYVARHGSGRSRYDDYGYRDYGYRDYGYRGYSRPSYSSRYYSPRYYDSRRSGFHYHGRSRSRCYRSHRPHIHFGIHFGF
jgi:hypothetical protein